VRAAEELRHVRGEEAGDAPPPDHQLDEVVVRGGENALARAREVMSAVLNGDPLPAWFTEQCTDDTAVQTCTLDRWSLRAWRFWLEPDNRRWWWWSAEVDSGEIRFRALVRSKPYLRGSLDWLLKAAANA
jgi:hypothetical protein